MGRNSYSTKRSDHIEFAYWLVFNADGSMRMARGQPDVGRTERAMSCVATLPLSLFKTPELRATITIGEQDVSAINLDIEAAAGALRQVIGCDIDLRINPAENNASSPSEARAGNLPPAESILPETPGSTG